MRPPIVPAWVLRQCVKADDAAYLLGDLSEEFEEIARARGPRTAARWYWRQAALSLGPLLRSRFVTDSVPRDAWLTRLLNASGLRMLTQHIRHTLRVLRSSPAVTCIAVVTLALGIGANTAVFSVVDAVLLRPLPYAAPDQLVSLWQTRYGARTTVGLADLDDYGRQNRSFDGVAGFTSTAMTLTKSVPPDELVGEVVSWNLFGLLGVQPAIGRGFGAEDARSGAEPVVMLTNAAWRIRFAADPDILGRSISLNDQPHTVVGVMPAAFHPLSELTFALAVDFFLPAVFTNEALTTRGQHDIQAIGRLKPGVSVVQAQRDLDGISNELRRRFPRTNSEIRAVIAPLRDDLVSGSRPSLLVILGAVGLVLLIACVNVANLLMVRALGQRREVAIRVALGASRAHLITDFVMRGLVLSLLGGAAGLVCGVWTRDMLVAVAPRAIRATTFTLSSRVLAATALLSLVTGVLAGLLPALQVVRRRMPPNASSAELAAPCTRSVTQWRGALLAGEMAAALLIPLGAGLLVRTIVALDRVQLGFDTDRVLTFRVRLPHSRYADPSAALTFFDELHDRLKRVPGVSSVAFANEFPMRGGWGGGLLLDRASGRVEAEADLQAVSAEYFSTLGIPLVRGRLVSAADGVGSLPVAVVSQTFVARLIPDRDPIGVQFRRHADSPAITIVGVVGDVRRDGKTAPLTPQVYFSAAQTNLYAMHGVRLSAVAIRSTGEPYALVPSVKRAVASIDADQPIANVRTLDEVLSASMAARRFNMLLLTSFALLALALAVVGVYGVVAHAATQRTREIGIRVALGATRANVVGLILKSGLAWSAIGVSAGLVAALASTRLMMTMLFGVAPTDPATFFVVSVLMLAVALGASYLPARRAARVDPVVALRSE